MSSYRNILLLVSVTFGGIRIAPDLTISDLRYAHCGRGLRLCEDSVP